MYCTFQINSYFCLSETCAVSTDAVLRNQYKIGTLLPNKRKTRVAYTDGPVANIACRIMIQTKITKVSMIQVCIDPVRPFL